MCGHVLYINALFSENVFFVLLFLNVCRCAGTIQCKSEILKRNEFKWTLGGFPPLKATISIFKKMALHEEVLLYHYVESFGFWLLLADCNTYPVSPHFLKTFL